MKLYYSCAKLQFVNRYAIEFKECSRVGDSDIEVRSAIEFYDHTRNCILIDLSRCFANKNQAKNEQHN